MNRFFKLFLKSGIILIILVGILILASLVLEQKIVEKAVTQLNEKINVPVQVENITFSLIRKFPHASLQLNNVVVYSSSNINKSHFTETEADTLLYLKELYLSLDVLSLLKNKLEITKAYAQKGKVNVMIDKNANANYLVIKEQHKIELPDTSQNELTVLLNQIQLKEIDFNFNNQYKHMHIKLHIPFYTLNGSFYKKNYTVNTKGKLLINSIKQGEYLLSNLQALQINMQLNVTNNSIQIISSNFNTNDLSLSSTGNVVINESVFIDMAVAGESKNIESILNTFPEIQKYDVLAKGKLGISAIIKGTISNKVSPYIGANFNFTQGSMLYKKAKLHLNKIAFAGSFSNGKYRNLSSSQIDIKNFEFTADSSSLSGNIKITNLLNPFVEAKVNTSLQINDLNIWNTNVYNTLIKGYIKGSIITSGLLDINKKQPIKQIINWDKKGEFLVNNGAFYMKKPELNAENISSSIKIRNHEVSLTNISGNIQNSAIKASINIENAFSALMDSTIPYKIQGILKADQVSYSDFKPFFEPEENSTSNFKADVSCSFECNKVSYEKIEATNASGYIQYYNGNVTVSNLKLNALGGNIQSKINYLPKNKSKYLFQTHTKTTHVDINELFSKFNNFGQNYIQDKHLKGHLTSDFDLEITFNEGKISTESIELLGHLQIENGHLINFKPIMEAAQFSEIKELEHIEFSLLENDILISNNKVTIPSMDINSNAFDISLFGWQHFMGDYEYHMRIYLSDFLEGKSKRLAKQQSEFGLIEDDGFGRKTLYLLAFSKNNKSKVKLDGEEIRNTMKLNIREEKKEFKKALHDQFGWFKKDTTLNKKSKPDKKQEFIIEWDEE